MGFCYVVLVWRKGLLVRKLHLVSNGECDGSIRYRSESHLSMSLTADLNTDLLRVRALRGAPRLVGNDELPLVDKQGAVIDVQTGGSHGRTVSGRTQVRAALV